jgi:hypothetical protein
LSVSGSFGAKIPNAAQSDRAYEPRVVQLIGNLVIGNLALHDQDLRTLVPLLDARVRLSS